MKSRYLSNIIFSFPAEMSKIQYDEDEVRQDISNAIQNFHGTNEVLNIPFKVFETLVKKQIEDLKAPAEKCIGLVVKELEIAVEVCTERVSVIHFTCNWYFWDEKAMEKANSHLFYVIFQISYPEVRKNIRQDIMEFIHKNLDTNVDNILSLVQMESAYLNYQPYEFKTNE